jgi:hypothetical protein
MVFQTMATACEIGGSVLHPIAEYFLVFEIFAKYRVLSILRDLRSYFKGHHIPGVVIELPFLPQGLKSEIRSKEAQDVVAGQLEKISVRDVRIGLILLAVSELLKLSSQVMRLFGT